MDFIDNALEKAKETLNVVSKKTEEVVQSGKQKFNIASLENQLSKDYKTLGEIYYNILKDSEIDDEQILKLYNDITNKNAQIEELKNNKI